MRPAFYHYLLAHTAAICAGIGVVGALVSMLGILYAEDILLWRIDIIFWLLLTAFPMAGIGGIVGVVFLWGIWFGHLAARLQGWPFAKGDRVWILTGKHKNEIVTIYEIWEERGQVRVDLGPEAKEKVDDVFCAVAVCRVK